MVIKIFRTCFLMVITVTFFLHSIEKDVRFLFLKTFYVQFYAFNVTSRISVLWEIQFSYDYFYILYCILHIVQRHYSVVTLFIPFNPVIHKLIFTMEFIENKTTRFGVSLSLSLSLSLII